MRPPAGHGTRILLPDNNIIRNYNIDLNRSWLSRLTIFFCTFCLRCFVVVLSGIIQSYVCMVYDQLYSALGLKMIMPFDLLYSIHKFYCYYLNVTWKICKTLIDDRIIIYDFHCNEYNVVIYGLCCIPIMYVNIK